MKRLSSLVQRSVLAVSISVAGGSTYAVVHAQQADEVAPAKPKFTVEQVMEQAMMAPEGEKSLRDRVVAGAAKPEEQQRLLDLVISLPENKPPQGDVEAWQKRANAVVVAGAKVVVGRQDGVAALRKATACAACHKAHKPPAE